MNLISSFDLHFEQALYAVRDPSLVQFFTWVTQLGEYTSVIPGLTLIVAILLAYRKRRALMAGLLTSVFGSYIAIYALKELVARPRPGAPLYVYFDSGFSFPSAHATLAVALYAFLLWLIWDSLSTVSKKVTLLATTVLIVAIGFSRLYLGLHYPSDVLAGYILGGLFVLLGIKITKYLEQKTTSVSQ